MLSIGEILNETYRIDERIGAGGGGEVFKAYHLRMEKHVAIKRIKEEVKGIVNIRAEVDIMKKINNEHIPSVSDFIELDGDIYTVMDYIDGENMDQIYKKQEAPYSEAEVKKYALQLCNAIKCIHNNKPHPIIHSDIKPANVMKTEDGTVYLIDFNISAIASGNVLSTGASNGYSAPEQCKRRINAPAVIGEFHEKTRFLSEDETFVLDASENYDVPLTNTRKSNNTRKSSDTQKTKNVEQAYIDTRTDIYGLGATIYYLLTKRKPVDGTTDFKGIKVSAEMQKIIRKAMEAAPEKRYQTIEEMEAAINNIGNHKKTLASIAGFAAVTALTALITLTVADKTNKEAIPSDAVVPAQDIQTTLETTAETVEETTTATTAEAITETTVVTTEPAPELYEITEETRTLWTNLIKKTVDDNIEHINNYSCMMYIEDFNSDNIPDVALVEELPDKVHIYDTNGNKLYSFILNSNYHFRKNPEGKIEYLAKNKSNDDYYESTEPFYFTGKTIRISRNEDYYDNIMELVNTYADYAEFINNASEEELEDRIIIRESIFVPETDFIDLTRYEQWDNDQAEEAVTEIIGAKSTLKTLLFNDSFAVDDEFSKICRIEGLEELTLYGNIKEIEKISQLTNLKKLTIRSDKLDNLAILSELKSLTYLDLQDTGISDIQPLSELTNLTHLILSNTETADLTPLSALTNLTYLNLDGCSMIENFSPISELKKLTHLNLSSTKISEIAYLSDIPALSVLNLRGTSVSDFNALAHLKNLTDLDLQNTNITDLSVLSELTGLTRLNLKNTKIDDLTYLSGLTELTYLDLDGCTNVYQLPSMSELKNLSYLNLSYTEITDLTPLFAVPDLTDLRMCGTVITNLDTLSALKKLNRLDLSRTEITDLTSLSELTELTDLDLHYCQGTIDLSVLSGLNNLTQLNLGGTEATSLAALAGFTNLNKLDLSRIEINDLTPLSKLTNLVDLNLYLCTLNCDPSPLANLKNLTVLNLSSTEITNITALSGLTNLSELNLESCSKIKVLPPMTRFTNLSRLNLSYTGITDISYLSALNKLTVLNLSNTEIADISSLAELKHLTDLNLTNTKITDISSLSQLEDLKNLNLSSCTEITDFSPVDNLKANIIRPEIIVSETEAVTEENTFSDVSEGDEIQFGSYSWLVLRKQDDKILVTTSGIIEKRGYNDSDENTSWEKCSLREYLNGDFYNSFSDDEKEMICLTDVENDDNPKHKTDGGSSTSDNVFILSFAETEKYFGSEAYDSEKYDTSLPEQWVWLRNPGLNANTAMGVYVPSLEFTEDKSIDKNYLNYYGCLTDFEVGIRPAMWISIE